MELYLDAHTHIITNEKGRVVSLDNARHLWEAGEVGNCSLSFQRLAHYNYDFEKLDTFYNETS